MKGWRCFSDVEERLHAPQIAIGWEMECLAPIAGGEKEKEWKRWRNEKERRSVVARAKSRMGRGSEVVKSPSSLSP
jgi:hypothetical protein